MGGVGVDGGIESMRDINLIVELVLPYVSEKMGEYS